VGPSSGHLDFWEPHHDQRKEHHECPARVALAEQLRTNCLWPASAYWRRGFLMRKARPRGTPRSGHTWTPKMRPTKNRHGKAIAAVRTHKEGSIPSLEDSVPKPLGFNAFGQNCPSGFPYTSATLVNFTERLNYPQPIGRVHGVHVWPDFRCPLRTAAQPVLAAFAPDASDADASMRGSCIRRFPTTSSSLKNAGLAGSRSGRVLLVWAATERCAPNGSGGAKTLAVRSRSRIVVLWHKGASGPPPG
jgi:hypothetical protein